MLIGSTVPTTNSATSAMIAIHSGPITVTFRVKCRHGGVAGVALVTVLAQWPSQ